MLLIMKCCLDFGTKAEHLGFISQPCNVMLDEPVMIVANRKGETTSCTYSAWHTFWAKCDAHFTDSQLIMRNHVCESDTVPQLNIVRWRACCELLFFQWSNVPTLESTHEIQYMCGVLSVMTTNHLKGLRLLKFLMSWGSWRPGRQEQHQQTLDSSFSFQFCLKNIIFYIFADYTKLCLFF